MNLGRVADWVDRRTGLRALVRHVLDEPIPGGARWAYVFGSALAALFLFQAASGVLLALFYSPSSREAWGSVYYITHHVQLGWFIRGMHHWGASAMILVMLAHLLQVTVYGAYRAPRELGWWTGLLLMFLVLGFAFTGYVLPWDQKGYWAVREVGGLIGSLPIVGGWLQRVFTGGGEPGNLALLRVFAVHVFVLPALIGVVKVAHVALFRRHGVTPHPSRPKSALARHEPFWPKQLVYDLAFAALVITAVVGFTFTQGGAPLEAPGSAATNYPARPEWYFRWLFELRRLFPARHEAAGVFTVCMTVALLLAALPYLDRGASAALRRRWPHVGLVALLIGGAGSLTTVSLARDARDSRYAEARAAADRARQFAVSLARDGIPPGGADELYMNDPRERGRRLYQVHCASCHHLDGSGGAAPDLGGYGSREWVRGVIADPTTPRYFGGTVIDGMEPTDATAEELDLLTDYSMALATGPGSAAGAELFEEKGCATCHARDGEDPMSGPSMGGYLSRKWVMGVIRKPSLPEYYGEQSRMPAFEGKLNDAELEDLLEFLLPRRWR